MANLKSFLQQLGYTSSNKSPSYGGFTPQPYTQPSAPKPSSNSQTSSALTPNQFSANTGATSTKPTVVSSPKLSSAGQNYASSLNAGKFGYDQAGKPLPALGSNLPTYNASQAPTNTPTAQSTQPAETPQSKAMQDYINAYKTYQTALTSNSDVKSAKQAYNDYVAELNKSVAGIGYKRGAETPLSLVRGEQARLLGQAQPEATRLQNEIGIAQDAQQASVDSLKAGVDLQGKLLEMNKPVEVGGILYQPQEDGSYKQVAGVEKTPSITDQYGTGAIGEYNFAKSQGYEGSFTQYQNEDANRKKSIAAAGASGGGLGFSPAQINSTVNSIAGAFDNEPIVKNFNVLNEGYQFAKSIPNNTTNPADDQGLIYAFAKAMDPGSVVREGEYATVQKYAQSWIKSFGKGVQQAINGTGFLSEEARKNIKKTIETKYNSSKTNYDNVYKSYTKRIEDAKQGQGNALTDYSQAYNNQEQAPSGSKFDYLAPQISIKGKNSYLPRSAWAPLSVADKNALLAEAEADGYPLLIQ